MRNISALKGRDHGEVWSILSPKRDVRAAAKGEQTATTIHDHCTNRRNHGASRRAKKGVNERTLLEIKWQGEGRRA